jgi:hypothetical protein
VQAWWRLYELLRAHTAKVIRLEMRRICNTDANRATGWTASMSSLYVGIGMVWYGMVPLLPPRQCVLSQRVVASCSVDPSGHSGQ